jgi:N utilization substance protein A
MNKDLIAIFEYLEREKGIKREVVISAIEESLKISAKKSVKNAGDVHVKIDPKTGDIDVYVHKDIVEEVEDPETEISLEEAQILAPECEIGQKLEISITPATFGRIAAQTARQIIGQKLRGAERDVIYEEYRHREGEVISGTVKSFQKGRTIMVDLGKVEAVLPDRYYPKTEHYHIGERVQALLLEVKDTEAGGAEVILSRSHPQFVQSLFMQEVPELQEKLITIEKIARDPGYRTKMVVKSEDPKIDPVGTCVGVRGSRIKNVIRELNNEKIDVIPFSERTDTLIKNALSPIEIKRLKESETKFTIIVSDEDYPIAIGKKGMNARLLAELVGKEIEIQKITDYQKLVTVQMAELGDSQDPSLDAPLSIAGMSPLLIESLISAGYDTLRKVLQANPFELTEKAPGINYLDMADKIIDQHLNK